MDGKCVWLVKSSSESDKTYEKWVKDCGFKSLCIPALSFKNVNESALRDNLSHPENYSGMILTSTRAVEAVLLQYKGLNIEAHHGWSTKKIFVVGETTGKAVRENLHLDCTGAQCGNAHQLAEFILREVPAFEKPLLFPCSSIKKEDLPNLLAKESRDFRAIVAYETAAHPNLKSLIDIAIAEDGMADIVVFFSPSGVEQMIPVLKRQLSTLAGVTWVALGPSTNAALVEARLPVAAVCQSPSPEALAHTLKGLTL